MIRLTYLVEPTIGATMWLDCEIQLAGSPEHRQERGVHIRVETLEGRHPAFPVDISTLRYDLSQFYAQPAWGIEGPADCFQTGPGYVYCEPQGLANGGAVVIVATLHESDALRPLRVSFGQLSENSDVAERLSA